MDERSDFIKLYWRAQEEAKKVLEELREELKIDGHDYDKVGEFNRAIIEKCKISKRSKLYKALKNLDVDGIVGEYCEDNAIDVLAANILMRWYKSNRRYMSKLDRVLV